MADDREAGARVIGADAFLETENESVSGGEMSQGDQLIVEKLRTVWSDLAELCEGLTDEQWSAPTDCPGWDVKDQLAHIVGTESWLLGRALPDHEVSAMDYVKNPIGRQNEIQVDWRRSWPPEKVLSDFKEVTGERLKVLVAYSNEDWEKESFTPVGPGTVRDFMEIRIFDSWVHEQDIRRAIEVPGGKDGIVAEHALERLLQAMPFVVGKKAKARDGATVVFEVTGEQTAVVGIGVADGRARPLNQPPSEPTARITLDFEAFACLGCGRWDSGYAMDAGRVTVDGDEDLAHRVVDSLNFMI